MENNKSFQCEICNKIFKLKTDLTRHINKKNKCSKDDIKIDGKKVYKCYICDKIFKLKHNYEVHINRKNKCLKDNNIDDIEDLEDDEIFYDQVTGKKLEEISKEDLLKIIKNMNNNITNNNNIDNSISNITNNINNTANVNIGNFNNNTINIVSHGREDVGLLVKEEVKDILNSGYNCVYKSVMYTYFNSRLPQFSNIRYTNPKSTYCQIFVDGEWKLAKFTNVVEDILTNHFGEVSVMCTDNNDLFESNFRKNLVTDFITDYKRYVSYDTEDIYPDNWNLTMKREKQKEVRNRLNKNRDEIKTLILNKSIEIKKIEDIKIQKEKLLLQELKLRKKNIISLNK
jgi:uncharacterized C2H2 Zn-finger protein